MDLGMFTVKSYEATTVARRLRHELSSPARTLGLWVRIPLQVWMSVF
jgi:hypothetical protein